MDLEAPVLTMELLPNPPVLLSFLSSTYTVEAFVRPTCSRMQCWLHNGPETVAVQRSLHEYHILPHVGMYINSFEPDVRPNKILK